VGFFQQIYSLYKAIIPMAESVFFTIFGEKFPVSSDKKALKDSSIKIVILCEISVYQ